jgi:hypothetical protein
MQDAVDGRFPTSPHMLCLHNVVVGLDGQSKLLPAPLLIGTFRKHMWCIRQRPERGHAMHAHLPPFLGHFLENGAKTAEDKPTRKEAPFVSQNARVSTLSSIQIAEIASTGRPQVRPTNSFPVSREEQHSSTGQRNRDWQPNYSTSFSCMLLFVDHR